MHRNVLVVPPGGEVSVPVTLQGCCLQAEVRLDGLPEGWTCAPPRWTAELASPEARCSAEFVLHAHGTQAGEIVPLTVVVGQGDGQRRVPVQVLVAEAPLVREAEQADETSGAATVRELAELSGAGGVEFTGRGRLAMDFTAARGGTYALWLRARSASPG